MSSSMPKQVQRQLEEVAEIEKQMFAKPEGSPADAPVPDAVADAQNTPPAEAPPTPAVEPAPVVEPAAAPKPVDWEAKYKTLQGMFNSEVGKLQAQVRNLLAANQELEQRAIAAQAPQPPQPNDSLVTDKDREAFGADLLDVQRRVAQEVMREHVLPLQRQLAERDHEIAQLKAVVGRTGGEVAAMSFEQRLETRVPGFAQLNQTPDWIEWLRGVVPDTGEQRMTYAQAAFDAQDVEKVAKFVESYRAGRKPPTPDRTAERQAELQRQVAPTATAASASTPQQRVYTSVEYDRLWEKCIAQARQGKVAESAALEAELTSAMSQGRVR